LLRESRYTRSFFYLLIYLFFQIAVGRFKNDQIAAITQLYLKETAENFTRKVSAIFGQFQRKVKSILRYDAIQDDNYFNVQSKTDMRQLNLQHGTNN